MSRRPRIPPALLLLVLVASGAAADDASPAAPDTSRWACRLCTYDYGWGGYGETGLIGVDSGSYWFGRYSGLYHSGLYLSLDGDVHHRDAKGDYLEVQGSDLGLGSRLLTLDAGRQGLLEFRGLFQDIPYAQYRDAQTPFLGVGGPVLGLPANWVYGGSTGQMSALPGDLQGVGIRRLREIYSLGFRVIPPRTHWSVDVKFVHDRQAGTQATGASFLTTASLLPAPISYNTDQIDGSIQYARSPYQLRLGYYGSFFHDAERALLWTNPFAPYNSGAGTGRMSVAPGNSFNQLSLSGAWQIRPGTRLMASAAQGLALQDAPYIPATVNPTLQTALLPAASLDGRVNVGNYHVRLNTVLLRPLSFTAEYLEDRRDNRTPQAAYQQVVTDTAVGTTRINQPYSFDRSVLRLFADLRVGRLLKLEGGAAGERFDRSYQEVARSYTMAEWGELRTTFAASYGFTGKYYRSRRTYTSYDAVPSLSPPENPLLRRFDLANRLRQQEQATAFYNPWQSVSLGLSFEHCNDSYYGSQLGLTYARDYNVNFTGNWSPTQNASFYTYLSRQLIWTEQAGSQSGSQPDWYGHTAAHVNGIGLGGQWKEVVPKLDVGADLNFTYSREDTSVAYLVPTPGFPDDTVHDLGLRLFSRYHLSPNSSLRFGYQHERFVSHDWALDNVGPATVPSLLSLGVSSPQYRVNLFALTYKYEF